MNGEAICCFCFSVNGKNTTENSATALLAMLDMTLIVSTGS